MAWPLLAKAARLSPEVIHSKFLQPQYHRPALWKDGAARGLAGARSSPPPPCTLVVAFLILSIEQRDRVNACTCLLVCILACVCVFFSVCVCWEMALLAAGAQPADIQTGFSCLSSWPLSQPAVCWRPRRKEEEGGTPFAWLNIPVCSFPGDETFVSLRGGLTDMGGAGRVEKKKKEEE